MRKRTPTSYHSCWFVWYGNKGSLWKCRVTCAVGQNGRFTIYMPGMVSGIRDKSRTIWNKLINNNICVPGSSVGISTGYGMDGPGIESRWGWDFPHLSRLALVPNQPHVQLGTGPFLGVGSGRGVTFIPHNLLVPRAKNRVGLYHYSP
jgi:hypothetical protein